MNNFHYNPLNKITESGQRYLASFEVKMKNLLILIALVLIVAFTGNAKAGVKRLTGELVNEGETLVVYSREGRVIVHADEQVEDCFYGEYELSIEPKGDADFKFLETVICRGKAKKAGFDLGFEAKSDKAMEKIMSKINAPACGMLDGVPTTFTNTCELKNSGARKLFLGVCERAIGSGIQGHRDLRGFDIHSL